METAPSLALLFFVVIMLIIYYAAIGTLVVFIVKSCASIYPWGNNQSSSFTDALECATASEKRIQVLTTTVLCAFALGGFGGIILWLVFPHHPWLIAAGLGLGIAMTLFTIRFIHKNVKDDDTERSSKPRQEVLP